MSDIVERRLRGRAEFLENGLGSPEHSDRVKSIALYREAADEIARLRNAFQRIDNFIVAIAPKPTRELAAIRREIDDILRHGAP